MLKTNSTFSENFLNAVQTAYTVHAELNRPAQNRRQQLRAWWPMKHVGNLHRFRNWNTILAATWYYAHHHQPEHHRASDCCPRPRCVVWWRALNALASVPAVTDMILSLTPLTFRKTATRPLCHSQAGVGLRAVASWLLQRRPNRTSSLDTGADAESPQCGSTGCGRPGTTWSRDSFPLRAALVADCCAHWLPNLPSGTQVVCWPSTWLH